MEETSLKEVFKYSILRDRVERLRRNVHAMPESVVPWLGAGVGASAGFPPWSNFLLKLSARLAISDQVTAKRLISSGFLDLAADFICSFAEVNLEREMVNSFGQMTVNNPILSRVRKLGSQIVVTTNYDRLVEVSMPWLIPLTPQNYRTEALKRQHCLLKVHGTIQQPESWVLTRWQYARHYNAELVGDLGDLFRNRTVLFLGCSLIRDEYLQVLKGIPKPERASHFALLCVDSDEEGKAKGELLLDSGIELIPYRTEGKHALVEEVLEFIQPSAEYAMKWVRAALDKQDVNRAVCVLSAWLNETDGGTAARLVADTLAHTIERLKSREDLGRSTLFTEFSAAATKLDPTSSYAWRVRAEVLESLDQDSTRERDTLKELFRQESVQASNAWPRTTNKALGDVYAAYRKCDFHGIDSKLRALVANPPSSSTSVQDRLAVLALRVKLANTAPSVSVDTAQRLIPDLSDQARPFAHALVAYHVGEYEVAIKSLTLLEKRWRAATAGKGLGFSLHLRALSHLGLEQYPQALMVIDRCHAAYVEPQKSLIRKFYRSTTPSELSYDIRALGSPELFALIDFWRLLSEINGRQIQTSSIERAYEQLLAYSNDDRLLQAFKALVLVIHPGVDRIVPSGTAEIQLQNIVDEISKQSPGLLRDLDTAICAISNSHLAPKWLDRIRQRLFGCGSIEA